MHKILRITEDPLGLIEFAGRNCTNTLDKMGKGTKEFIKRLLDRGHESVLEHATMSVFFDNISRGMTHELVRHRHCAFSQRSTRYALRKDRASVTIKDGTAFDGFYNEFKNILHSFISLGIDMGISNDELRQLLPIGTISPIIITTNFREWRTIFKLRTAAAAHWEIRTEMVDLLEEVKTLIPVVFDDI